MNLTENMQRALVAAMRPEGISPWDYGAGTIGALKKANLIASRFVNGERRYFATDAARAELGHLP